MLCLLAGLDIFSICATDKNSYNWIIRPVQNNRQSILGLSTNPIFGSKALVVVYHRWNYAKNAEHFDPAHQSNTNKI